MRHRLMTAGNRSTTMTDNTQDAARTEKTLRQVLAIMVSIGPILNPNIKTGPQLQAQLVDTK
jgi:hypothetical protein